MFCKHMCNLIDGMVCFGSLVAESMAQQKNKAKTGAHS